MGIRRTMPLGCLSRQKLDANLVAVNAHQLAAAIRETRRRQKQKKFLEVQPFERVFDE